MPFDDIVAGDIVRCSVSGRVFHATVRGRTAGGLVVVPIEKGVRIARVTRTDVVDHWAHRGRLQTEPKKQVHPEQRSLGDLWDR